MSSPTPEKPRLVCRVVRAWSSFANEDRSRDSAVTARSKHVATCRACQEFFAASDSLTRALKHDAIRIKQPTPDGLERRIMQAVTRAAPRREPRSLNNTPRLAFFSLAAATAAAAVVVAVVLLRQPSISPPSDGGALASADDRRAVAQLAQAVEEMPGLVREGIQTSAGTLAPKLTEENPLLQEVASVRHDARSALAFLAANFLPEGTTVLVSPADSDASRSDRG